MSHASLFSPLPYNRATFYGGGAAGYTDYPVHDDPQEAGHDKHVL